MRGCVRRHFPHQIPFTPRPILFRLPVFCRLLMYMWRIVLRFYVMPIGIVVPQDAAGGDYRGDGTRHVRPRRRLPAGKVILIFFSC